MDDFYGDCNGYNDYDNQEEMWDDGFSNDQDDIPDHPRPLQEPRQRFNTRWQVVLSLRTLPNPDQRIQTLTKAWPKTVIEESDFNQIFTPEPCPFCRIHTGADGEATGHRRADLRRFIDDNIRKAGIYNRWRNFLRNLYK